MALTKYKHDLRFGLGTTGSRYYWGFGSTATTAGNPRRVVFGSAAPTSVTETWNAGDIMIDESATAVRVGWKCTVGGSPGTWVEIGAGTGFAVDTEQFLTLAASAALANERVLTPGTGFTGTDAGAGSTYTLNAIDYPSINRPPGLSLPNSPLSKSLTNQTVYAYFIGRARRAYTSINVRFRMTVAASTSVAGQWAGMGVAVGDPGDVGSGVTLTLVGSVNTGSTGSTTMTAAVATVEQAITCSGITKGDHLWVLFGVNSGAGAQVRAGCVDNLITGYQQSLAGQTGIVGGAFTVEAITENHIHFDWTPT